MSQRLLLSLLVVAVGCGGENTNPQPVVQKLAPPENGKQVMFGPFNVAGGKEVQLCRTMKLDNEEPVGIDRINVLLNQGSHHFILFRSDKDYPDQVFPCWGTVNFEEWDFMMDVNRTGGYDWKLPEGQGFVFKPHQQIMVQSHYVNATTVQSPDGGVAYMNLHYTAPENIQHELHGLFTVNTRLSIPPRSNYSSSRLCTFSRTAQVVAMTGHFHARGKEFSVNLENEGTDMGRMYFSDNWDAPVFQIYSPPKLMNANVEGLRFTCTYYNETDQYISFGGRADVQEHCNLFLQYYNYEEKPGAAPLSCLQGSGGW